MTYIHNWFQWTEACADTIDWNAYTQAISWYSTHQIQITKLCNNLFWRAHWANRYNSLTTSRCLHCGEPEDKNKNKYIFIDPRASRHQDGLVDCRACQRLPPSWCRSFPEQRSRSYSICCCQRQRSC
jgi:hypothetical protein